MIREPETSGLDQPLRDGLCKEESSPEIDCHDLVKTLGSHADCRGMAGNSRRVDQNVEGSGFANHSFDCFDIGEVKFHGSHDKPVLDHRVMGLRETGSRSRGDGDVGAELCQRGCGATTNPGCASGNERRPAIKAK